MAQGILDKPGMFFDRSGRALSGFACLKVVQWLKGIGKTNVLFESLIQECREWMRRKWVVNICHTYREGNIMADYMAKRSARNV